MESKAAGPLSGGAEVTGDIADIEAPSSKSLGHRALIAAALACGDSVVSRVSESEDVTRTREALELIGAKFTRLGKGVYAARGLGGAPRVIPGRIQTVLNGERHARFGVLRKQSMPPAPSRRDDEGKAVSRCRSAPCWSQSGISGLERENALPVFIGESGTSCRLLTAVFAAGEGCFHIHGSGRMHERPMGDLPAALGRLGAEFVFAGRESSPPFWLRASGFDAAGGECRIGTEESSQYLSGLLLAAPLSAGGLRLRPASERIVSLPYVGLTLEIMERFGVRAKISAQGADADMSFSEARAALASGRLTARDLVFSVPGAIYRGADYAVEGDWSGASYLLAAGAIGPRAVRVSGLEERSLQADAAFLGILREMGARVEQGEGSVTVAPAPLRGISADLGDCPDLAPTLAALAAHAAGPTVIRNAAHLKVKESDRLSAPAEELGKAGCRVEVKEDGLVIIPPPGGPEAEGKEFCAHNDHRMAMSLALLGLAGARARKSFAVRLDNPACVAKSFPDFWECWEKVLGRGPQVI
ncbi:MAG: 3-phosphoshikimate 1-carboxyvinyltransferase [Desulfovibrio sp.]|jgi:3-phosphoshikimate 1-carboxyvinyltransferase|nr:3-phosphoshikimate 1-carboxyvinyltransferase [Desulfovibrio sp.]